METENTQQGEKLNSAEEIPEGLRPTLQKYRQVFASPEGLPPSRGHEHSINLQTGSNPVGTRPYRYPQAQKDEIERLIQEMLAAGIIRPSKSPFSSPFCSSRRKMDHGAFAWIIEL